MASAPRLPEVVDLRDHPLPIFDGESTAKTPRQYPKAAVARLGERLDRADGCVIATAEYNHGHSAVLKNAMDWTFVEWRRKPISFVGWGNVGAPAPSQLRLVAVEFRDGAATACGPPPARRPGTAPAVRRPRRVLDERRPRLDLLADDLSWWAAGPLAAGDRSNAGLVERDSCRRSRRGRERYDRASKPDRRTGVPRAEPARVFAVRIPGTSCPSRPSGERVHVVG